MRIEYSKVAKLPFIALCEFCKKHGHPEPKVIISDNTGSSILDKYRVRVSVVINNDDFIEENTGYNPKLMVIELAEKLCKKLKIKFDIENHKYYL